MGVPMRHSPGHVIVTASHEKNAAVARVVRLTSEGNGTVVRPQISRRTPRVRLVADPRHGAPGTIGLPGGVERCMRVEIWSDVVCPWCYVGKRNFETALSGFEHRDHVEVVWRSFELDPSAPAVRKGDYAARLAEKYRVPPDEAQAMVARMTTAAARVGLEFRFDRARPGNTFDAHRLIRLAGDRGVQDAVKERLLRAMFSEGEPIGDRETLVRLAVEAGLDEGDAAAVLDGDAYSAEVRADERQAADFDIHAVPFFVIDRTFGVPGAQPPDVLTRALQHAWQKNPTPIVPLDSGPGEAPGCEGDSCAI